MPFAGGSAGPPTLLDSVVPLRHAKFHPLGAGIAQIVTLPGQVVISFLLVFAAAWKLRKVTWITAWVAAVAVELVFRHALTRPALDRHGVHLVAFDTSWPSGHALRSAIVAAAIAAAWPRLRGLPGLWLVAAIALLELAGFHTPTDIAGGLLLATVTSAGAVALERSGLLRRRAARACRALGKS
jgi:membrane-associated phospholipid phosphatase